MTSTATGKRIIFAGGSVKAGRHAVQHLVEHGYLWRSELGRS